jgi:hypothetical protein
MLKANSSFLQKRTKNFFEAGVGAVAPALPHLMTSIKILLLRNAIGTARASARGPEYRSFFGSFCS